MGSMHGQHLLAALHKHYKLTNDWGARLYIGVTLDWDCNSHTVTLSMHEYVNTAIKQFNHPNPTKPEDCLNELPAPQCGVKVQLAKKSMTHPNSHPRTSNTYDASLEPSYIMPELLLDHASCLKHTGSRTISGNQENCHCNTQVPQLLCHK